MKNQDQEAFDVMVAHLRKQGDKCTSVPGVRASDCLYRNDFGLKCAVGALISDDVYYSNLEGWGIEEPEIQEALADSGWGDVSMGLLADMQIVHDNCGVQSWETRFAYVAKSRSLNLKEVP